MKIANWEQTLYIQLPSNYASRQGNTRARSEDGRHMQKR